MPLTKAGAKVLASMKGEYGAKKGASVFYASINAKKAGSSGWHKKGGSYDKSAVKHAQSMK